MMIFWTKISMFQRSWFIKIVHPWPTESQNIPNPLGQIFTKYGQNEAKVLSLGNNRVKVSRSFGLKNRIAGPRPKTNKFLTLYQFFIIDRALLSNLSFKTYVPNFYMSSSHKNCWNFHFIWNPGLSLNAVELSLVSLISRFWWRFLVDAQKFGT